MVEKQKESNEAAASINDIPSLESKFRSLLGTYVERADWNEDAMRRDIQRIKQKATQSTDVDNPTNQLTYLDVLSAESEVDRAQALRVMDAVHGRVDFLHPEQKIQVIRAHVKLTTKELLARGLSKYAELLKQYRDLRGICIAEHVPIDNAKDHAVLNHGKRLFDALRARVQLQLDVEHGKQGAGKEADQKVDAINNEIWELLKEPQRGAKNGDDAMLVFSATLELLQKRYDFLLKQANDGSRDRDDAKAANEAIGRIQKANKKVLANPKLREQVKEQDNGKVMFLVPKDEHDEKSEQELRRIFAEAGEDYDQYKTDMSIFKRAKNSVNEIFKRGGEDVIKRFADLNREMSLFQVYRSQLATIRHHFNQSYELQTTGPLRDKGEELEKFEDFLRLQQLDSLGRLNKHLVLVENKVLSVGLMEFSEDIWNKEGRLLFVQFADILTNLETGWLPHFEEKWSGPLDYLRDLVNKPHDAMKQKMMGALPHLLEWPAYEDGPKKGQPKDWSDLTPEDRKRMKDKQKSVREVIETFKKTKVFDRMRESVGAVSSIVNDPDFKADNLLDVGAIDLREIPQVRITPQNRRQEVAKLMAEGKTEKRARQLVILRCFQQLEEDTDNYNKEYFTMFKTIHEVVGIHMDWEDAGIEFAKNQRDWAYLALGLLGAGVIGGYITYRYLRSKIAGGGRNNAPTQSPTPQRPQAPVETGADIRNRLKPLTEDFKTVRAQIEQKIAARKSLQAQLQEAEGEIVRSTAEKARLPAGSPEAAAVDKHIQGFEASKAKLTEKLQSVTREISSLEQQSKGMQADIQAALNAAEGELPAAEAAALRGDVASALVGRELNSAERAVVMDMHAAGEIELKTVCVKYKISDVDAIRRAAPEARELDQYVAHIKDAAKRAQAVEELKTVKIARINKKAVIIRNAADRGVWRRPWQVAKREMEMLMHSGTTGVSETEIVTNAAGASLEGRLAGLAELLKDAKNAEKVLANAKLEAKLEQLLQSNPEFARSLIRYLDSAKNPEKFLMALNKASASLEDASLLPKVFASDNALKQAAALAEAGKEITPALKATGKLMRGLKFAGKAVPVVADAAMIYTTILEWQKTNEEIERLERDGSNPELLALKRQEHSYQAANFGMAGVGVGAGMSALLGIGEAFTGPIALATLPVTAVLYSAYSAHELDEDFAKTERDWADESLISLLAKGRSYSFHDRVGGLWKVAHPEWHEALVPIYGQQLYMARMVKGLVTGELKQKQDELIAKMKTMGEKQVRAIVMHTTTVDVPKGMLQEDGRPNPPHTEEEVAPYREKAKRYVDAKVQYFLSMRQDETHVIRSYGDVTDLMDRAEAAGKLAADRPELEKQLAALAGKTNDPEAQRNAEQLRAILQAQNGNEAVERYAAYLRDQQIDVFYATALMTLVAQESGKDHAQDVEGSVRSLLRGLSQNAHLNFCLKVEEHFGSSARWTSSVQKMFGSGGDDRARRYFEDKMEKSIREKGADLVRVLQRQSADPQESGVFEFRLAVQKAKEEVEKTLPGDPEAIWQEYRNLSGEEKEKAEYAFEPGQKVEMSEKQKQIMHKGEEYLRMINATANGNYYSKQYGLVTHEYLYMTFDTSQGKWVANKGEIGNYKDPDSFRVLPWRFEFGSAEEKYNQLLDDLGKINRGEQPSEGNS